MGVITNPKCDNVCQCTCHMYHMYISIIIDDRARFNAPFDPRKSWLHLGAHKSFLKGMGGPGAPHVYTFQRAGDAQTEGGKYMTLKVYRHRLLGIGKK